MGIETPPVPSFRHVGLYQGTPRPNFRAALGPLKKSTLVNPAASPRLQINPAFKHRKLLRIDVSLVYPKQKRETYLLEFTCRIWVKTLITSRTLRGASSILEAKQTHAIAV